MSHRRLILRAALWIAASAGSAAALPPNCPQKICACLGEARRYAAVAGTELKLRNHKLNYGYGSFYTVSPFSNGPSARRRPPPSARVTGRRHRRRLLIGAATGTALKVKGRVTPETVPLLLVQGDLVTGGGQIDADPTSIDVGGVTDTTGTHSRIGSCQQALVDAAAVSDELAALPPTKTLPPVVADGGYLGYVYIDAGPGVEVIETPSISVRPMKTYGRYYEGTELIIRLAPGTESVIINTRRLSLGPGCLISVFGAPTRVLINLVDGGSVKMNHDVTVEAPILARGAT
jgi:hypothetical protein